MNVAVEGIWRRINRVSCDEIYTRYTQIQFGRAPSWRQRGAGFGIVEYGMVVGTVWSYDMVVAGDMVVGRVWGAG